MGDASVATFKSIFGDELMPQAPVDLLYGLVTAYEADDFSQKVDLGVGAYRDDKAKPWVLPTVQKAHQLYSNDPDIRHEYLPIAGIGDFNSAAQRLMLGTDSPAIRAGRVCTFQAVGGTGALRLGCAILADFMPDPQPEVYISDPSWPMHRQCLMHARLKVQHYPYFRPDICMLDIDGMLSAINAAPARSVIVLHACAHNPTGVDPTNEQWRQIAQIMRNKGHLPFFDCAYQGFASGLLDQDAYAVRYFIEQGFEVLVAQSFSKNLGLYGQRVGAFHYIAAPGPDSAERARRVASQLAIVVRSEMSSLPIYGAKVASLVLNDEKMYGAWERDLLTMTNRIKDMRQSLKEELHRLGTPGSWEHLTSQIGMFSFTGLSPAQVEELKAKWHVYMLWNGRISVAGLNTGNVKYFAQAVDDVVRRCK